MSPLDQSLVRVVMRELLQYIRMDRMLKLPLQMHGLTLRAMPGMGNTITTISRNTSLSSG